MNETNKIRLINDWHSYSCKIVRKGKRLFHDILTSWPLSTETLVNQITDTFKDYYSLWNVLLKLIDGDKPSADLHLYTDTYTKKWQPVGASLRSSLSGIFDIRVPGLGKQISAEALDLVILHASDAVSIVHYGCYLHPVMPAIIALLHDILDSSKRRIDALVAFPLTRRGTRSLKTYLKLLTSQWFVDVAQNNGIGCIEIIANPTIVTNRRASLETLFHFDTVGSAARLYYHADCNQTLQRTLAATLEYYPSVAQFCLNKDQCPTRLQLFDPVFSPSSALSSAPDKPTEEILSLFYAYQDVSADVGAESTRISIYTTSCTLSVSTVAQLFRPDKEHTHHYYLWKHNEAAPLPIPPFMQPQIALVCIPPLSDQAMTAYFQNLIRNTDGCIYISCLNGSYVQSLQHMLLSFLSADEFYIIRPDKLFNSISGQNGLLKLKEYKAIIFSSSHDILLYMGNYRMFLPSAKGLVLFNGVTSELLLNTLVDSLDSSLKHVTICCSDSSICSTIKDVFQRFYDGLDVLYSRKTIRPKRIGHDTGYVASGLIGASMLSQEIRKKAILFYGDVELLDTLFLAAAVARFGPGDGLCMADLSRETVYQFPIQKVYNWKPVKISPEEWLLTALCISETYFSGVITTTTLCDNVIEAYCEHLRKLSIYQRQLVIKLLYLTMGTQPEYCHLVNHKLGGTCPDTDSHPIVKRCYQHFKVSTLMHMRRIVKAIIVKLLVYRVLYPSYNYRIDAEENQNLLQRHFEESIPLSVEIGSLTLLLASGNIPLYSKISELGEWYSSPLSSCLQGFCVAGISRNAGSLAKSE